MFSLLCTLALGEDTVPPTSDTGVRIFLGAGSAQNQGSVGEALELGAHRVTYKNRVGSQLGGSLSFYRAGALTLPVLNADAMVRWRPSETWRVQPYASAGIGLSMLLILPFPAATIGLGLDIPVGNLHLDGALRGRWIADPYGQTDGVSVTTLELGLRV